MSTFFLSLFRSEENVIFYNKTNNDYIILLSYYAYGVGTDNVE